MKTEELRHGLDDLAGGEPDVDDAFGRVTRKVRTQRARAWGGVAGACALVVAVVAVGAAQLRPDEHKVTVTNPAPVSGGAADFNWNRVPAPAMTINRIVTANGKTFVVGSTPDGKAAIAELDANGAATNIVDPAFDPTRFNVAAPPAGTVNDLVGIPGALVAVGDSIGTEGKRYAAAWRSTDGGRIWHGAAVETSIDGPLPSIDRVVSSNGVVYALGTPPDTTSASHCASNVWTSSDATDFRVLQLPADLECAGPEDAVDGPAGLLITTAGKTPGNARLSSSNSIAWTKSGDEWSPHPILTNEQRNAGILAVAGDDRGYVAVGSVAGAGTSAAAIWWSADGTVWRQVVTAHGDEDPSGPFALFTSVAHSQAGWIAVGARGHHDQLPKTLSDATVWTSPDGEHWTENTRDGSHFEQFARANSVGATAGGFAILGFPNMTAEKLGDSGYEDDVLWLGSAAEASTGIVEGSMHEIGGRAPGGPRAIAGSIVVTSTDAHETTVPTDSDGRFSTQLPPGTYRVVGHSPLYGDGNYDCRATPNGPTLVRAGRVAHVDLTCQIR